MRSRRSTTPPPGPVHPFDRLHGTDTSGLLPATWLARSLVPGTRVRPSDLTAYYGVAPSILHSLLDIWKDDLQPLALLEDTVFLDVGAGKGRALLLATEYPFLRVEGVELNPALAAIAAANLQLRQANAAGKALAPVSLHCADATRHPLPSEPTLAFLFHPFEKTVLRRFLRHVEVSLTRHPRPFDLLYVNAEHAATVDEHPAFHCVWTGRVPMSPLDHAADLAEIANQTEYGSTGDEYCAIYRAGARSEVRRGEG